MRRLAATQVSHCDKYLKYVASGAADLNLPGYGLHPLKGDRKDYWAIWVSGNWRIIFTFEGGDVTDVDLVDYH